MAFNTYPKPVQDWLMRDEGGYSNDAHDPGGITLNGVIQTRYNEYRKSKGLPQKALTKGMLGTPDWEKERDEIYQVYYARPVAYTSLPAGVDYTVYDYGVNSGPGRAGKVLRKVVGLSTATSSVTQEVVDAVKKRDPNAVIEAVNSERKNFLQGLSTCPYFCKGWLPRVARVLINSKALLKGSTDQTHTTIVPTKGKAIIPEPKIIKAVTKGAPVIPVGEEAIRQPQSWLDWFLAAPMAHGAELVLLIVGLAAFAYLVHEVINHMHTVVSEEPHPSATVVPVLENTNAVKA